MKIRNGVLVSINKSKDIKRGHFTVPDGVTSIGEATFDRCRKLTSITLPDGITSIGRQAFFGCVNLKSIIIPYGVTSIGDIAFYDCVNLTSITIPDSVTSIGGFAFSGCGRLCYNEYDNAYYFGNETNPYFILIKAKSDLITSCIIN